MCLRSLYICLFVEQIFTSFHDQTFMTNLGDLQVTKCFYVTLFEPHRERNTKHITDEETDVTRLSDLPNI